MINRIIGFMNKCEAHPFWFLTVWSLFWVVTLKELDRYFLSGVQLVIEFGPNNPADYLVWLCASQQCLIILLCLKLKTK